VSNSTNIGPGYFKLWKIKERTSFFRTRCISCKYFRLCFELRSRRRRFSGVWFREEGQIAHQTCTKKRICLSWKRENGS